jgi:hypothetical protein
MKRRILWMLGVVGVAAAATAAVAASTSSGPSFTNVPSANTKSTGYAPANMLSAGLQQIDVAQGATKVENPMDGISYYGYDDDVLNEQGQPVMIPVGPTTLKEAHKTEPDKNTYLEFKRGLAGADPNYDYGTHFLFQGHESAAAGFPGPITRINLDADGAHRVTVLATKDSTGALIRTIDGSTWDPFARRLLFTTENAAAPTYSATPNYPSVVTDISGALGRGGYEGIQNDSDGNLWIAEDIGGGNKVGGAGARLPNSFLFRYVPKRPGDLQNGKLEALQVLNEAGTPITLESQTALNAPDEVALHTYGMSFRTKWIVVHDTAVDGTTPFNATRRRRRRTRRRSSGRKRASGGSHFTEFLFDETGDTNAASLENATAGGWGSVLRLTQRNPSSDTGTLRLFFKADSTTSSFDNCTFLSRDAITFVQDQGDGLHTSQNQLDSGFILNVKLDYSDPGNKPVRWLAEGRDPSATYDASNATGNDGDNEITGVFVSDGDTSRDGILGAKIPNLADNDWRWFWTQQHGDNFTWEVLPTTADDSKHGDH